MLRRCLDSPHPRFGMVPPPWTGVGAPPGNDYGTMLEIRSVQMLADGRAMVETWGAHRFRILERGTLDGYMLRLEDEEERDLRAMRRKAQRDNACFANYEHAVSCWRMLLDHYNKEMDEDEMVVLDLHLKWNARRAYRLYYLHGLA